MNRVKGLSLCSVPPVPSEEGRGDGWLTRSSDPAAGYARRNHLTYSSVARTTSPCSVAVLVYVSRGGALYPSGRLPNASRSSRSFNLSRLGVTVGVPLGGSAGPSKRFVLLGLYVRVPCSSASLPLIEPSAEALIGADVTRHFPSAAKRTGWGCRGCRQRKASNRSDQPNR